MPLRPEHATLALLLALGAVLLRPLAAAPPARDVEIAGYATSLRERTPSQRHNAQLAAQALNGREIATGATFSFNAAVRSWSWDRGYVKAPVSYDGELVRAYGGGVCQTSTTLYNAALLAGLPIVERHPHVFAPHYVPPGRDAAVAQYDVDLRFRNPYPWPIRIYAAAMEDRLEIRLYGRRQPAAHVEISERVLDVLAPARKTRLITVTDPTEGRAYVRNPGATGYRVVAYRTFYQSGKELRTERLSDDTYQAMSRVVQFNETP